MKYEDLLSHTDALMNQIFWFEQKISKPKAASHRGVTIKYVDIKPKRDAFIRELKSTATSWVYSNEKYTALFDEELKRRGNDALNAHSYLLQVADQKFRKGCPQGQFGELLLFNFIQFFFGAPPLLRKMPITTNPGVERHGADAIHFKDTGREQIFFLGESKCYESRYSFNKALQKSVDSIVTSFDNIENELLLYEHDDFIDPRLRGIAEKLRNNKLDTPRFELVCLFVYEETTDVDAPVAAEIESNIKQCLEKRWADTKDDLYKNVRGPVVERIHYVAFPSWKLSALLSDF